MSHLADSTAPLPRRHALTATAAGIAAALTFPRTAQAAEWYDYSIALERS